ncbi:hypothetical protein F3Y22_tig00116997pilonHSYRG00296 [Hibiscus syriacus]|uniref:DUF3741 domain-containing protein n=1 Tax=Hibiscus syriacus TaxID=106335 RepID=A0A6A2XE92_HIBSY|nr:hypothetical protein F3Y22_tig00116997pilonHSYRG00296 [Hibiscus syriacus]
MKLLSSSPSISSSSTASFDPKQCTQKSATPGCLSGSYLDDASSKVTPGIVARLMGLDSLPETSLLKSQIHPNSITRSRQGRKEQRSKQGSGELKQRKENKENRGEKVPEQKMKEVDEQVSQRVLNALDEEKMNRRNVEKANREMAKCREANDLCLEKKPECISEDSSPVSVLVFDQFINDHDVPPSEEDSKAAQGLNPRRKLSPDLENYECKPPCNDGNLMDDGGRANNIEVESMSKDRHCERNLEGWNAICRVIEAEVAAKPSWLCSKSNNGELEILLQILDQKF